jgi:hypothetical protein
LTFAASDGAFVPEHVREHAPTMVKDTAVKTALLGNAFGRLLNGTRGARSHVVDSQFFELYDAVVLGDPVRQLVQIILASIGFLAPKPGNLRFHHPSVRGVFDLPGALTPGMNAGPRRAY